MPSKLAPHELATPVLGIARDAAKAILEVYDSNDPQTVKKADDSPLTVADSRAHHIIADALADLTPGVPILSEESAEIPFTTRSTWGTYWLVDPLDGTKEFLSRNGEFTVNIALIVDHTPVLGVVSVPVKDTVYWGLANQGAWRAVASGAPTPIHVKDTAATPVRIVGSKSHRGSTLDTFLEKVGSHELIPVGSSLKFCMIAEGNADVYPRLGPTSEWDTAAAHAVVTGAGGVVLAVSGQPLTYNSKPELLNPNFIVFADRTRPWLQLL
jgi:3'(2'), 5'-bisphosphate nucleotidase